MRKVVAGLFISLDGVTESPDKWQFDHFDEDMMAAMGAHIAAEDTILLGRVTYQEWAPYWPTSTDEPYASHINNTPKYVVSTTLKKLDWNNSHLIKTNVVEEVKKLKQQPGQDILVYGSGKLVNTLLQNDLVDELRLMVHPVVLGSGRRLFDNNAETMKALKLAESKTFPSGIVLLTYHQAK